MRTLNPRVRTYATYLNAMSVIARAERDGLVPEVATVLVAAVGERFAPVVISQDLSTARPLADRGITVCN